MTMVVMRVDERSENKVWGKGEDGGVDLEQQGWNFNCSTQLDEMYST